MAAPRAVLDEKRRRLINARIDSHGVDVCIAAIDGCRADAFSMGANDRGRKYNGINLIFRDAQHVEDFAALAPRPEPKQQRLIPNTPEQRAHVQAVMARVVAAKDASAPAATAAAGSR